MRVAVVGAGIMGAASAFYLACAGLDVHVFEAASCAANGVTRDAFGWINTINGDPGLEEAYALRVRAVAEYSSVLSAMPEVAAVVRRGSLIWKDTPEQTVSTASLHAQDPDILLVSEKQISMKEPALLQVPSVALYAPNDIAVSPSALVSAFLWRAEQKGARIHSRTRVTEIVCEDGTAKWLQIEMEYVSFDVVLLAVGVAIDALLQSTGISLGVHSSPAVLLRYHSNQQFLVNILSFPGLEMRQGLDGSVLVVEDFHPGCEEDSFAKPRARAHAVMTNSLRLPADLTFQSGAIGQRPMLHGGLPSRGFSEKICRLYCLVGHPGVILAPLLAREATEEILRTA